LTSSIEVVPNVERQNGIPARPAAWAGDLTLGVHQPGETRRRYAKRQRHPVAEHVCAGVDLGDIAKDCRVKLDVAKGLPGPGQRQLLFGGAIGVIERRFWCAALGNSPQILDGERRIQPPPGGIQFRLSELQQRRQIPGAGYAPLHRAHRLVARSGQYPPDIGPSLFDGTADLLQ
jgi:hypothetical protein